MDKSKGAYWTCDCSCGTKRVIKGSIYLRKSVEPSCGCADKERMHNRFFIDLTGQRFGKLTVKELDHMDKTQGA